jgi:hypothetical protein
MKDPDINPHNYTHPVFDKGVKNAHWIKDSLFKKCTGKLYICMKKTETTSISFTLCK